MIKRIFFSVSLLLFASNVWAYEKGSYFINFSGGLGISTGNADTWSGSSLGIYLNGDPTLYDDAENKPDLAVNFGVDINYFLSESFTFLTGLYYDSLPFKTVYPGNTASNDLELTTDFRFLTIPAGMRVYFDLLFFGGGVYYGILLSDDAEIKSGSTSVDVELENTKNNFGFFVDLGLYFDLSETNGLILYARYKRGLVNVYEEEDMLTNIKLIDLTLNFGYSIKI